MFYGSLKLKSQQIPGYPGHWGEGQSLVINIKVKHYFRNFDLLKQDLMWHSLEFPYIYRTLWIQINICDREISSFRALHCQLGKGNVTSEPVLPDHIVATFITYTQ